MTAAPGLSVLDRLHAGTVGHEERYWQIRDEPGPRGVPPRLERYEGFLLGTQGWGDLRALRPLLRSSVQSDACPGTTIFTPDGVRLIDFEKGGYHFSVLDAAYARLGMPHCFWAGRLPEHVITATEAADRLTGRSGGGPH